MTRRPRVTVLGAVVRLLVGMAGGYAAYLAAPSLETTFFPIVDHEYLVPFNPAHPEAMAEVQLDRVCWRTHLHRIRRFRTMRRSIALILPDGTRYFPGLLDGRTGDPYSSKDARPYDWEGDFLGCTYLPNAIDTSQGFKIESYGEYQTAHGLWLISHLGPIVNVPPIAGEKP